MSHRLHANSDIDRGEHYLIANISSFKKFRVTMDKSILSQKGVTITTNTARVLKVSKGQKVRIVKSRG